jgi:pyridoxamine 5'-phosphate oxidase
MNRKEVFEFAAKNPVFNLATVEGNKPHVRMMMLFRSNENGIIFVTGKAKELYKQLQANQAVELCFFNQQQGQQLRIEGNVEFLEDLDMKKQIVEAFKFLKPVVEQYGYECLACCRLKTGRATIWSMETNLQPKQYIQL